LGFFHSDFELKCPLGGLSGEKIEKEKCPRESWLFETKWRKNRKKNVHAKVGCSTLTVPDPTESSTLTAATVECGQWACWLVWVGGQPPPQAAGAQWDPSGPAPLFLGSFGGVLRAA